MEIKDGNQGLPHLRKIEVKISLGKEEFRLNMYYLRHPGEDV